MKFQTLASGSKGNCSILYCGETIILIDAGIVYATLNQILEEQNIHINDISGILITHNHSDHIKGLKGIIKKTKLNAYIPEDMYESLEEYIPRNRCNFIDDNFNINDVEIELIHTSHDAPKSVGFLINYMDKSLVYITDTGYINRKYLNHMKNKTIYLLESNHDEVMLMNGPYPYILKERILGDEGHLSNKTTAKYLKFMCGNDTKYIVLAHLSEHNNTEELAYETTKSELKNPSIKIIVARQHEIGPLIEV